MDGAVAEGVRSSHFCRNGGRVPQSPSHGVRMLLNPQGEFQKRVLQLLVEIKDTIHIATSSVGTSYEVKPANTEEELNALENRLEDKNEGAELSKHLKRLGGVDAADHVKKSMAA
ncbi:hypothetical protein cypCar_00005433 [Cyprinus carpio]|nr:hypothetical protein cypCar_00005433 [Cyprinus carpio]